MTEPINIRSEVPGHRSSAEYQRASIDEDQPPQNHVKRNSIIFVLIALLFGGLVIVFIATDKLEHRSSNSNTAIRTSFNFSSMFDSRLRPSFSSLAWSQFSDAYISTDNSGSIIKTLLPFFNSSVVVPSSQLTNFSYTGYSFSFDEQYALFSYDHTKLYRHSGYDRYRYLQLQSKLWFDLSYGNKLRYAEWSPKKDEHIISYVAMDNNLYLFDVRFQKTIQITNDGAVNSIINGINDWVYEEELAEQTSAIFWNNIKGGDNNGQYLAFLKFNESSVPTYEFPIYQQPYNQEYYYKYPKAGSPNSLVSLCIYTYTNQSDPDNVPKCFSTSDIGGSKYSPSSSLIGDVKWLDSHRLAVKLLPRFQTDSCFYSIDLWNNYHISLLQCDFTQTDLFLEPAHNLFVLNSLGLYVDLLINNDYQQIAAYDLTTGKFIRFLTDARGGADSILSYNENHQTLYYISAALSDRGLDRGLFVYSFRSNTNKLLVAETFQLYGRSYQDASFSANGEFFTLDETSGNAPGTSLYSVGENGLTPKLLKVLENNNDFHQFMSTIDLPTQHFVSFPSTVNSSYNLNGYFLFPPSYDPSSACNNKYPVLTYVYGGPGDQQVTSRNSIGSGSQNGWHTFLTSSHNMVVFVMDGIGTGGQGMKFQKSYTYKHLGVNEAIDVISSVRDYLKSQCFVDNNRVAIWGWSFGGFLTSMIAADPLQTKDSVFSAIMSVAPVTSWALYDTIYTERYMQSPQVNKAGYDGSSLMNRVNHFNSDKLNYLLIHGTADDNVHFQNSALWVNALIDAGKQFSSFYYPNRAHSLTNPITGAQNIHLYRMLTNHLASIGFIQLNQDDNLSVNHQSIIKTISSQSKPIRSQSVKSKKSQIIRDL